MAQQNSKRAWSVCIIASLFFAFVIFQINTFNALDQALLSAFHLSSAQFGNLAAGYFYGNVLFLIPAGVILDRASPKKVLQVVTLIAALSTYLFAHAESFLLAEIARVTLGFAGAFAFLSVLRLNLKWFSHDSLARATGLSVTLAMLGGMLSQTPFQALITMMGWRNALSFTAGIGLVIFALITLFVKEFPTVEVVEQNKEESPLKALMHTVKNKQNWLGGSSICFLNLPIFIFGAGWGLMYLTQFHHISRTHASWVVSMIFVGMIIGSPLMGYFSDRYKFIRHGLSFSIVKGQHRSQLLSVSAIGLIFLLGYCAMHPHLSWQALSVLFFLIGLVSSAQVVGYPYVAEQNDEEHSATAVSIASTLVMAGGFIQPVFGWVLTLNHDVEWVNHVPHYSAFDFRMGLGLMLLLFSITLIMTRFLKKEGVHAHH